MTRDRLVVTAVLVLGLAGLIALATWPWRPADAGFRLSPLVFVSLLVVELSLMAMSAPPLGRLARIARLAVFVVPLVLTAGLRIDQAFGTPDILDWDETYYLSLAVTAADGRGLYPYIFGYGPMPIAGGIGYAAYAYALAVHAFGPTVMGLRAVSLLGSLMGLACLWFVVRALYGTGSAWMAAALTSALRLFVLSNSARMDSLAFAAAAAGLLLVARAFERWSQRRWHLLAGLVFGLGLEVHIDTTVTAIACGGLYLAVWLRETVAARRLSVPLPMLLYVTGWAAGLLLFVCVNILPDPAAFYKTTVLLRVDATTWYSAGTATVSGTFLSPRILAAKEMARYGLLFRSMPAFEIGLVITAGIALFLRRSPIDRMVGLVAAGVVATAAVVLNTASPLYFIHVLPALVLPLGPLFTHGLTRQSRVAVSELRLTSMLPFALVISALCAVNNAPAARAARHRGAEDSATVDLVRRVRAAVAPRCKVAGDGSLYLRYFGDYPYFVSTRPTEVRYAMLYFGSPEMSEYWESKQPDAVVAPNLLPASLAGYISRHQLAQRGQGLWVRAEGCRGGP